MKTIWRFSFCSFVSSIIMFFICAMLFLVTGFSTTFLEGMKTTLVVLVPSGLISMVCHLTDVDGRG